MCGEEYCVKVYRDRMCGEEYCVKVYRDARRALFAHFAVPTFGHRVLCLSFVTQLGEFLEMEQDTESPHQKMIEAILAIRDVLGDKTTDLQDVLKAIPQLVVVGQQSSGKSALLEALSGGVKLFNSADRQTTKFPLVYRYRPTTEGQDGNTCIFRPKGPSWGNEREIPTTLSELQTNPQVTNKMIELQRTIPADQVGRDNHFVEVEVFSNRLCMTFVDLPGLVSGTQEGSRLQNLVWSYMRQNNTFVVFVCQADADPSTNLVRELIRERQDRLCLCVWTRVDLVASRGQKAIQELLPRVQNRNPDYQFATYGHWLVRLNDSHQPCADATAALKQEKDFFDSDVARPLLPVAERCGVSRLLTKLDEIYGRLVREKLPQFLHEVQSLLATKRQYQSKLISEEPDATQKFKHFMESVKWDDLNQANLVKPDVAFTTKSSSMFGATQVVKPCGIPLEYDTDALRREVCSRGYCQLADFQVIVEHAEQFLREKYKPILHQKLTETKNRVEKCLRAALPPNDHSYQATLILSHFDKHIQKSVLEGEKAIQDAFKQSLSVLKDNLLKNVWEFLLPPSSSLGRLPASEFPMQDAILRAMASFHDMVKQHWPSIVASLSLVGIKRAGSEYSVSAYASDGELQNEINAQIEKWKADKEAVSVDIQQLTAVIALINEVL